MINTFKTETAWKVMTNKVAKLVTTRGKYIYFKFCRTKKADSKNC